MASVKACGCRAGATTIKAKKRVELPFLDFAALERRLAFFTWSSFRFLSNVPAWLHSLVQHADNFDQIGCDRAIIKNVHRPPHLHFRIVAVRMLYVKAADAR